MPRKKKVSFSLAFLFSAVIFGATAASCTNQKSGDDNVGQTEDALCKIGSTCNVTGGLCHRPTVGGGPVCDLTCTSSVNPNVSSYQPTCAVGGCCDATHLNPGCPSASDGYLLCDLTTNVLVKTVCGDGKVTPPEECEPSDPTCNPNTCLFDRCGDGHMNAAVGEECDLGAAVNGTSGANCTSWCKFPKCGDGEIQSWVNNETCDPPGGDCDCNCQLIPNVCPIPSGIDVPCVINTFGCEDSSEICYTTPGNPATELDCQCFNGPDGLSPTQMYGTLLPPGADCSSVCVPWVDAPVCSAP